MKSEVCRWREPTDTWIDLYWRGGDEEVIGQLEAEQLEVGVSEDFTPEDDPWAKLAVAIASLRNNFSRVV